MLKSCSEAISSAALTGEAGFDRTKLAIVSSCSSTPEICEFFTEMVAKPPIRSESAVVISALARIARKLFLFTASLAPE